MKKFISTKLFLAWQEASQKGTDMNARVLKKGYGEFVMLLFSESATSTNRIAYHNTPDCSITRFLRPHIALGIATDNPQRIPHEV